MYTSYIIIDIVNIHELAILLFVWNLLYFIALMSFIRTTFDVILVCNASRVQWE